MSRPARPLRLALCQFAPLPPGHSPDASLSNLSRAHDYVRQAAERNANIVVFPEYFLSGIVSDPAHHHLAQDAHDWRIVDNSRSSTHWLESFRLLAKEVRIDIAVGTIVEKAEDVKGEQVLHNVAHYVSKDGEILGRYTKTNLWWPEKDYLTAGPDDNQAVFETEWGRVGLLICWDMAWPEAWRSLMLQHVDIVICPTYWTADDAGDKGVSHNPDSESTFLDSLIVTRAFENECCVVFVNCGGDARQGFIGRSAVTLPFKGAVARAKSSEEELMIVDVDLSILEDARSVYGMRKDLLNKLKIRSSETPVVPP